MCHSLGEIIQLFNNISLKMVTLEKGKTLKKKKKAFTLRTAPGKRLVMNSDTSSNFDGSPPTRRVTV